MTKRTDAELLAAIDKAGLDAELEAELALTPEERERELVKDGYDIDELNAEADAFFASLPARVAERTTATTPPRDTPRAPTEVPARAATATTTVSVRAPATAPKRQRSYAIPIGLALAAGMALTIHLTAPPPPVGAAPPDSVRAAAFRKDAREACDAQRWADCLDDLNDARDLDPKGDEAPDIQALRHAISEATPTPTPAPPHS